jgi:cytidylate kinase
MSNDSGKIIIAIDGHSSCGKSTLAKGLAKRLGYAYLDSGALYRAVTLYFIRHQIDIEDTQAIKKALDQINIRFINKDGQNHTILNGEDVEEEIRKMYVSEKVSPVAAISMIRRAMVKQQQAMGREKGIVMDGRDIGTVVFPQAELKLFVTASIEERTKRRFLELQAKGLEPDYETVKNNLQERDYIDSTRADSPLIQAEDAILLDNTQLSEQEQLAVALELTKKKIPS